MNSSFAPTLFVAALFSLCSSLAVAQDPTGQPPEPQPAAQPQAYPQAQPQAYPQAQPQAYPQAQPQAYPSPPQTQPVYVEQSEPEGPGNFRIPFFLKLGVAGTLSLTVGDSDAGSADLNPTIGGGVGFTFVFLKYIGVGPRISINRIQADGAEVEDDGLLAIDVAIAPQVRFPFSNNRFAVYGTIPFGVTVFQSEAEDSESELGINLGLMGGAEFFFGNRFGLFGEVGYQGRFYGEETGVGDVFLTFSELSVTAGGKFAF